MSDEVEVQVQPPVVGDLRLALSPGGVITGTLEVVGGDASALAGKLQVQLSPGQAGLRPPPVSGSIGYDGIFHLAGVTPGKFVVQVDGLPEDGYVKTIRLDDVPSDGNLDLAHGARGSRLQIVVGLDGAQISGALHGSDGGPVLSALPAVFLVAERGKIGPSRPARVEGGSYVLKGVPPGK